MKVVNRRSILAGVLAAGAAPAAMVEAQPGTVPKQSFIKGMIVPRAHYHVPAMCTARGEWINTPAQIIYEYDIYDGKKFVPLNSGAGQQVVDDLS